MKLRTEDIIILFARLAIGGVLLFAGFMKAVGPSAEFAAILSTYKLFPRHFHSCSPWVCLMWKCGPDFFFWPAFTPVRPL